MIFGLFRRRAADPAVERLHDIIVEQSRQPVFYLDYGIADTVDGRYDLLILHTFLVFRHLSRGDVPDRALSQALCDRVFLDLDRSLREMGVGDLSVSKRMKKLAQKFYGRVEVYDKALAEGDDVMLAEALDRNVYRGEGAATEAALWLARYVRAADASLAGRTAGADAVRFPDPATIG